MKPADLPKLRFDLSLFVIIIGLFLSASGARGNSDLRPNYSAVVPGLEYANVRSTNGPLSIHIARLDRSRRDFDIASTLGKGTIQGLASLSTQVKAAQSGKLTPLAGVNGDFFLIAPGPYQGDPEGLQIIGGELVSAPSGVSFWAESPSKLSIDTIASKLSVTWPNGTKTPFGLNQTPKPDGVVLFTPIFGQSTRHTNGLELVLEKVSRNSWLPLRANQIYKARVREARSCGDTRLQPDTAILSLGPRLTNLLASVKAGDVLLLSTGLSKNLDRAQAAIGGGPVLVSNGHEQQWPANTKANTYLLPRHPRTALGFNRKYFYLVEVDGRQKELSMGMSFAELAAFMKQLGCTEAMNLDGGGSATFWLNGQVKNSPSDKRERSLANALVIAHRETKRR